MSFPSFSPPQAISAFPFVFLSCFPRVFLPSTFSAVIVDRYLPPCCRRFLQSGRTTSLATDVLSATQPANSPCCTEWFWRRLLEHSLIPCPQFFAFVCRFFSSVPPSPVTICTIHDVSFTLTVYCEFFIVRPLESFVSPCCPLHNDSPVFCFLSRVVSFVVRLGCDLPLGRFHFFSNTAHLVPVLRLLPTYSPFANRLLCFHETRACAAFFGLRSGLPKVIALRGLLSLSF